MEKTERTIKQYLNVKDIKLRPLKLKFDITTLDMVISFIYKDSVLRTRKTLSNIYKLFDNIDLSIYENNEQLLGRIWIIKTTLYGKLVAGFENDENLKNTIDILKKKINPQ